MREDLALCEYAEAEGFVAYDGMNGEPMSFEMGTVKVWYCGANRGWAVARWVQVRALATAGEYKHHEYIKDLKQALKRAKARYCC